MKILGISAFYHDSAAALIDGGEIIAAAQEERFSRKKHDANFPTQAIRFCLEEGGCSLKELDVIAFYDKPFLKFERLLETYYGFAPKGVRSFIKSMPVWLNEKLFIKKKIFDELKKVESFDKKKIKLLFPEHHLSHAASAFYPSPFKKAAIITLDGVGEWATTSMCIGDGNGIKLLKEMHFPHSVGLLYSAFTYFLGFKVNSGEYKLMGLAPYGNPNSERVKEFIKIIKKKFITLYDDGSVWLEQKYFNYATGLEMTQNYAWEKLLKIKKRNPEDPLLQIHCDLAWAIQNITEEVVLKMAIHVQEVTGLKKLCLAGGVALNCVANGKLIEEKIFDEIYIQPAAGDAGGSLGSALASHYIYFEKERELNFPDAMKGSYLGNYFHSFEIEKFIKKQKAVAQKLDDEKLYQYLAEELSQGKIVGWFQGRMEFGPRALGARSILGDPRNSDMQKQLNLKIKYRESFRPFAPSVLEEDAHLYFEGIHQSPYMLQVHQVKGEHWEKIPENYSSLTMKEKLYEDRSVLPAITHVDFSARVQTVSRKTNPKYWDLLQAFKKKTGLGMLVNTSFNVRGEPIVCTPSDAYACFMNTEMDILVVENYLFLKSEQPEWHNRKKWEQQFELD